MKIFATTLTLTLFTAVTTLALSTDDARTPRLDWIKQLEGEWVQAGEDGKPTDVVISRYKITAGGSAVLEILFPGTDHEMVTVYYQDGDELMLTHFCVLGNQPTMRARFGETDKEVHYDFVRASSMKETDPHMHQGVVTLVDKNRMKSEWQKYTDGKPDGSHGFELVRRPN